MTKPEAFCGHCGGRVVYLAGYPTSMFYHAPEQALEPGCETKLYRHQKVVDEHGTDWWAACLALERAQA